MLKQSQDETGYIRIPHPAGPAQRKGGKLVGVRQAGQDCESAVIEIITEAFASDPVWNWVFPDRAMQKRYWKLFIGGANRHGTVFLTSGYEAVSVWLPPLAKAFLPEDEALFGKIMGDLPEDRLEKVSSFLENFDKSHPRDEPHYYLGLLGVQDHFRGTGIGMALLAENLTRIDAEKMPAYLESSNLLNNQKYASVGFEPVATFQIPDDGPTVTGMWRKAR